MFSPEADFLRTSTILVTPALECPADTASLLTAAPCASFSHAGRRALADAQGKKALSIEAFHGTGQPCMQASPLPKSYRQVAHCARRVGWR